MRTIRFRLGKTLATPGALAALVRAEQTGAEFLMRHAAGDWGELTREDHEANDAAVASRLRILSAYTTLAGERLWVITEADRSVTTILLPSEY